MATLRELKCTLSNLKGTLSNIKDSPKYTSFKTIIKILFIIAMLVCAIIEGNIDGLNDIIQTISGSLL